MSPVENKKGDKNEQQVEGEELVAGRQKGLASPFPFLELGSCVVELGINELVDSFLGGP